MASFHFFATTPKGLELLLVEELRALGAEHAAEKLAGVSFSGELSLAYKACLWSRLANRILLQLHEAPVKTPDDLYTAIQQINWSEHIHPQRTIAVHCICSQSQITHDLFAAQKVKDAIVDQLRDKFGCRPNVSKHRADVNIYVYLYRNHAVIHLDLSGESLHKRGYRLQPVEAPLKENLAAAILLRAGWPKIAKAGGSLLDPMCGSGTLLIEAALMAGDIAPGLTRDYFGFTGWLQHQPQLWNRLVEQAQQTARVGLATLPAIIGYDQDPQAVKAAFANIDTAGLRGKIHVEKRGLSEFAPLEKHTSGLVIVNPPYGERLGEVSELNQLYQQLGTQLKNHFPLWEAAVFTGNPELGKQMGLRARKYYPLFNGTIPCKLLLFNIIPEKFIDPVATHNEWLIREAKRQAQISPSSGLDMFINRMRKNIRHLAKQAKSLNQTEYRLYDADLPEYAFAIDKVNDKINVFEYEAPKTIAPKKVMERRHAVLAVLPELLNIHPSLISFAILATKNQKSA